jgi:hypothetical protein
MHEIAHCELEDIDVVIQLANRETVLPLGIVRDVEVLCGKTKYPTDFLVLGKEASKTCPIIFGRLFLNTFGAVIDCKKENFFTKFDGESYEFNFWDFYFRAPGSLVVLSFPQPLNFSSVFPSL